MLRFLGAPTLEPSLLFWRNLRVALGCGGFKFNLPISKGSFGRTLGSLCGPAPGQPVPERSECKQAGHFGPLPPLTPFP